MRKPQTPWLIPLAFAALAILAAGPGAARTCDIDTVPAATLLLPYFEVDVSGATSRAVDTAFAILNTDLKGPHIVHVTLWTEWAIPTVTFDVSLGAYDVLSVNLIDLFTSGAPPVPGVAGCTGIVRTNGLYFNPALPAGDLALLRKAHTGEPFDTPTGPKVASSFHAGVAKGYITIDVVKQCANLFPSSGRNSGYFRDGGTGIAVNDNVLVGDYFLVDNLSAMGAGEPMVHIRADKSFKKGDYTFYGTYVAGTAIDDRQPLGSSYASRFWTTFPGNPALNPQTDLLVWRDTKRAAPAPVPVATQPADIPLSTFLCCNEDENCSIYSDTAGLLALATQRTSIGEDFEMPYGSGWMKLDLNHAATSLFKNRAQGFVTTVFKTSLPAGDLAASFRAYRLASPCKP
jgi:hypothetical protein